MKKVMTKTVLTTALLCAANGVFAQQSYQDNNHDLEKERTRREATGVVGGLVVGGAIAGPPGAIAFAVLGAIFSDNVSNQKEKELAVSNLEQAENNYLSIVEERDALQLAMIDLRSVQQMNRVTDTSHAPCCSDTELVLHFQSNSSSIQAHYQDELQEFANFVSSNPDMSIQITGYADQRGLSEDNLALSQSRIKTVETTLDALGLENQAIQSIAYGESRPLSTEDSSESLFFDRRVVIEAIPTSNGYLTQIPD